MPVEVRIQAPEELKDLVKRLKGIDTALARGRAAQTFSPELNRGLIENSGSSGAFARGWIVSPLPGGAGILVRNVFGKALWVEEKTKPHVILPRGKGGMAKHIKNIKKLFSAPKAVVGLVKNKAPKKPKKKPTRLGPPAPGVHGVLAWRKGGKRAFSAYKVNASTKSGAFIYAKEVHHPGTKGKYAFRRTVKEKTARLFELLTLELKAIFKG